MGTGGEQEETAQSIAIACHIHIYIFSFDPFSNFHDNDESNNDDNLIHEDIFATDCTICLHKSRPKSLCSQAKALHKRRSFVRNK